MGLPREGATIIGNLFGATWAIEAFLLATSIRLRLSRSLFAFLLIFSEENYGKRLFDRYEFADFQLDVRNAVCCATAPISSLAPKVFDTLRLLVENAGHLMTKEELLRRLWPDTLVEENNLNKNISVLRKVLGEVCAGSSCIETVPRVGYRFVAAVRTVGIAASTDPREVSTHLHHARRFVFASQKMAFASRLRASGRDIRS